MEEGGLMALASWPAQPDPWLDEWVVWRIGDGGESTRPASVPADLGPYAYAFEFLQWCLWKRRGKPEPRPDIPKLIPQWAYPIYELLNKVVPVPLPPSPDAWLLSWAIWRFKNSPADQKPAGLPESVTEAGPYCWSFLRWAEWRRKNPLPPRPAKLPPSIPNWAWALLKQINIAVPPYSPPPPPPPPPPLPPSSWTLPNPIMFTAWGWRDNADFRDTDVAFQRMVAAGVKTVALQIGQFLPNDPARCRAYGLKVALWGRADSRDAEALAVARADGYIPQIEGYYEFLSAIENLEGGVGQGLAISTVTTLAGVQTFDGSEQTVEVRRLRAAGCTHAWLETYKQDGGAHFPISKMVWAAGHVGFAACNPVLGLWNDVSVSEYRPADDPTSLDSFGKQVGAYVAETMRPQDWTDFGTLGT